VAEGRAPSCGRTLPTTSNARAIAALDTTGSRGRSTIACMAVVRLFAAARDAAGTGRDDIAGDTVGDVLAGARERYGSTFVAVLDTCKIWVNGEPALPSDPVSPTDELAVLPPVSGG
jgi:molybdopterin synthase sulfur carrier subunit